LPSRVPTDTSRRLWGGWRGRLPLLRRVGGGERARAIGRADCAHGEQVGLVYGNDDAELGYKQALALANIEVVTKLP
jgi:hypothetical protein